MLTPPKGGLVLANVVPTQNVGVALNDWALPASESTHSSLLLSLDVKGERKEDA